MSLHRSYNQAKIIETLIEAALPKDVDVSSYPWHNGRENGFCFTRYQFGESETVNVFVAECRNSDDLTVTRARYNEWEMVTDAEYRARERFAHDDYAGCARRVIEILLEKGAP